MVLNIVLHHPVSTTMGAYSLKKDDQNRGFLLFLWILRGEKGAKSSSDLAFIRMTFIGADVARTRIYSYTLTSLFLRGGGLGPCAAWPPHTPYL